MNIRSLNLNSLVVFSSVYRHMSMTKAALELGMTQPGTTQHIRGLESTLEVTLFDRLGKKLIATQDGEELFESISASLESLEESLTRMQDKDPSFHGVVRIGMPIEFGNNVVLPCLAGLKKDLPKVSFHITFGLPHELNGLIMEGKIDFAFIDQYQLNPAIYSEVIFDEEWVLACSEELYQDLRPKRKDRDFFESLSYVDYQPGETILRNWFLRAFDFKKMKLKIAAHCFDVQGLRVLVSHSMGIGVLPKHVYENYPNLKHFPAKLGEVHNPISLAYLEQRGRSPLNAYLIEKLKEAIA